MAPALLPKQAGDRGTTDRRAAGPLARLARSGALPAGADPTAEAEALRALPRAREEALSDGKEAQFRLTAFVLRHDLRYPGRAPWNPAPLRWLSAGVGPTPAPHSVFQDDGRAVTTPPARLRRRDQERQERVNAWRLNPVVDALQGLRGVQCTVAVTTVAELGDLTRFAPPRALRKFWGLLPAESSPGERRRHGAMTTAGQTHARRALGDGAWAYRSPATVRRQLQLRLENHPKASQDLSWKAQVRRWKRDRHRSAGGTTPTRAWWPGRVS